MKKWQKVALFSASALLITALAACGSSKSSSSENGPTTIKMYQIGDKPDNLDKLLENANKILEKKVNAKLEMQYLGWGDYSKKMSVITSSGENYDIAFAETMS